MGKSDDLKLNDKEKKNLKSNKRKLKKTILIVVSSLFVLFTLIGFFGPRLVFGYYAKQVTAQLGPAAEYFTEFDLTLRNAETVQEVTFDGMTVTLPGEFKEQKSSMETACIYKEQDEEGDTGSTVIISTIDVSELNRAIDEMILAYSDGLFKKYVAKQLVKGFEDVGKGIPENHYALTKSCFLLTEGDYSFWNWAQGCAYVIYGGLKNELAYPADDTYIYEKEDICGFIYVVDKTKQAQSDSSVLNYRVVATVYSMDDFSTEHTLIIESDSLKQAFAIINSVEIE
jgi:hypothetical protein